MAAGLGFKTFTSGEVLTAADTNGYLMQGVMVFASASARSAAITAPTEGQYSYLKDTNSTEYYDGSAWVAGVEGDISGVTAGVGISGGGTSGTVTVTNSMATAIDAKGDLVPGTGADTFARLAVGTDYNVLSAQSGQTTGLLWAGASTSFTTTWSMDVGTPAIGNGTMTMTYIRYGKLCNVQFYFKAGSTTTFGTSGSFFFTIPFTAKTNTDNSSMAGGFYGEDLAVAGYSAMTGLSSDGTKMFLKIPQNANASWGKVTPFTWATGDFFNGTFIYEVA